MSTMPFTTVNYARNDEPAGTTVSTLVGGPVIYDAMHRLEYHPHIALIDRQPLFDIGGVPSRCEVWLLRSRSFPPAWEGRQIEMYAQQGAPGMSEFVLVD